MINLARRVHIQLSSIKKDTNSHDSLRNSQESKTEREHIHSRSKILRSPNPFKVITNQNSHRPDNSPLTARMNEDRCMPLDCLKKRSSKTFQERKGLSASASKLTHRRHQTTIIHPDDEKLTYRKNLQRLSKNYKISKEMLKVSTTRINTKGISDLVVHTDHKCIN